MEQTEFLQKLAKNEYVRLLVKTQKKDVGTPLEVNFLK